MSKDINIIVTSWSAAGGSTIALILANLFKLKYIYAGGVLKDWVSLMGYNPNTDDLSIWQKKYGEIWDFFWEDYIKLTFTNSTGILCEGKTAGFLLPNGKAFEVAIIADQLVRAKRAGGDGRLENIVIRDELHTKRFKKLFGIDLHNVFSLNKNYDLVIDNSNLTIGESLELILHRMKHFYSQKNININNYISDIELISKNVDKDFLERQAKDKSGKSFLQNQLKQNDLYLDSKYVFNDWKTNFKDQLNKFPSEMKTVILK